MQNDPKKLAVEFYFGELQYWKLPRIAADALEEGFDGPALRRLAGLASLSSQDIRVEDIGANDIDAAFREMGVDAPITEENAQLALAAESAKKVLDGQANAFEAATHIRIYLCHLSHPPEALKRIVLLSNQAHKAPRGRWKRLEAELKDAFTEFLMRQKAQTP